MRIKPRYSSRVTVALVGGIGNQLFGYAAGSYYALRHKKRLRLDVSDINSGFASTGSSILGLNIPGSVEFYRQPRGSLGSVIRVLFRTAVRFVPVPFLGKGTFESTETVFENRLDSDEKINRLVGYFQTHEYYTRVRDAGIDLGLMVKTPSKALIDLSSLAESAPSLSIHVRRGDYLKFNDIYVELGINYYTEALNAAFTAQPQVSQVFVFSDDMKIAEDLLRGVLNGHDVIWVGENSNLNDLESLALMTKMSANILANSTFSYWGALLNASAKVVIAPSRWFVDASMQKPTMPHDWLLIEP